MKGITNQPSDTVTYSKLTVTAFEKILKDIFFKAAPKKRQTVFMGLLGSHSFNWAMEARMMGLPYYHIESYGRVYGIVQISVGKKHSLNKIVVDMRQTDNFGKYRVKIGTREVAQANSFMSAMGLFKDHKDSQPDSKLELWKKKYGYFNRHKRRR